MRDHHEPRDNAERLPVVLTKRHLQERLTIRLHIAHEKAAPEDLLHQRHHDHHPGKTHHQSGHIPESLVTEEAWIEALLPLGQPQPFPPSLLGHAVSDQLLVIHGRGKPDRDTNHPQRYRQSQPAHRFEDVVLPQRPQQPAHDHRLQRVNPLLRRVPPPRQQRVFDPEPVRHHGADHEHSQWQDVCEGRTGAKSKQSSKEL